MAQFESVLAKMVTGDNFPIFILTHKFFILFSPCPVEEGE